MASQVTPAQNVLCSEYPIAVGLKAVPAKWLFLFDKLNSRAWYSIGKANALSVTGGETPSDLVKSFDGKDDPRCDGILKHARRALIPKRDGIKRRKPLQLMQPLVEPQRSRSRGEHLVCERYNAVPRYLDSSEEGDVFLYGIEYYAYETPSPRSSDDEEGPVGGCE